MRIDPIATETPAQIGAKAEARIALPGQARVALTLVAVEQ
jgi:hypothetical protein